MTSVAYLFPPHHHQIMPLAAAAILHLPMIGQNHPVKIFAL